MATAMSTNIRYMSSYGAPQPPPPPPHGPYWGPAPGPNPAGGDPTGGAPPPPSGPSPRRLTRSTTDRVVAGVAGGVAEYLGIDPVIVRVGFVVVALITGIGALAYIVAWVILPEGRSDGPYAGQVMPKRPWQDWDHNARSWAVVLGAIAVAFIWSFGLWQWWGWRTVPFWALALAIVFLWANGRHARFGPTALIDGPPAPPPTPAPPSTSGPRPASAPPPTPAEAPAWAAAPTPAPPTGPAPVATPVPDAASGPDAANPVPDAANLPGAGDDAAVGDGPGGAHNPGAARAWDYDFTLPPTSSGPSSSSPTMSPTSPAGPTPPFAFGAPAAPPPGPGGARQGIAAVLRALSSTIVALVATLALVAVISVACITWASGASFRGGTGYRNVVPATNHQVQAHYRMGAGDLDVNLSNVSFPPGAEKKVVITVGLGQLTIQVPEGTRAVVKANVGLGGVQVFGRTGSPQDVSVGPAPRSGAKPELEIQAHVGLGDINVTH